MKCELWKNAGPSAFHLHFKIMLKSGNMYDLNRPTLYLTVPVYELFE